MLAQCGKIKHYGEIEGRCETDCNKECPNGFIEMQKEECIQDDAVTKGFYRDCLGRYKCSKWYYYYVELKW